MRNVSMSSGRMPLHFVWVLCIFSSACSVTPHSTINDFYREVIEQRHDDYRIKEGDSLAIRLYSPQHVDLNQGEVIVLPDGKSDLFFMENCRLSGRTVPEVEAELRSRVAEQVRDPEVSLQVRTRGEKVYLVGEFERPQAIELGVRMTLPEAISAVGGLRVTGDTDYAILRRPYMNARKPDEYRIDLNEQTEALFLLPGDQIVLGRNVAGTVVHYIQTFVFGIFGTNPTQYASSLAVAAF